MKPIRVFTVVPSLPVPIEGLRLIAYNLRWAWSHEAIELFRRLDSDLWEAFGHNPEATCAVPRRPGDPPPAPGYRIRARIAPGRPKRSSGCTVKSPSAPVTRSTRW